MTTTAILDGAAISLAMFGEALDPAEYLRRLYPVAPVPPIEKVAADAEPLVARVNHGAWIASCSCGMTRRLESPGGVVFFENPLVWCICCWNLGVRDAWRPVATPPPAERAAIEAVLALRPKIEDRNWEPHETVTDLIAQNLEHGDPIPPPDAPPPAPAPVPLRPHWPAPGLMAAVLSKLPRRRRGR